MLNKVILIGRLTRDIELKTLPSGTAVANFTLAVDRAKRKDEEQKQADFIPVVAFGKTAEICSRYLYKGSMAAIDGRLQVRSYEKDGQKRYTTEVIANEIHFLTSKSKEINESDMDGFTDLGEVSELPF
jgi:single-strand DNA-binding protein